MSQSLYEVTVPTVASGLRSLKQIIARGEAHAEENTLDVKTLLEARLRPDMFSFTRQIQVATDLAWRGIHRLAGREPTSRPDTETSFAELADRVDATIDFIKAQERDLIDSSSSRQITLDLRGTKTSFDGTSFALTFMLPNFYFHVITAYAILRERGVPLGKSDYLQSFVAGR